MTPDDVTESAAPVVESADVIAPVVPAPAADDAKAADGTTTTDPDATADDDDDPDYDPNAEAIKAAVELALAQRKEELEQDARKTADRRIAEESNRTATAAEQDHLRNSFVSSLRESYTAIKARKFDTADGPVTLSDEEFQEFVAKPMQKHNSTVREIVQGTVLQQLASTAVATLPDADRSKFVEAASDKPLDEWLETYAEARAAGTKFVKDMQREVDAKVKAAEARGFARGQKRPVATPKQGTERATSANNDTSTVSGLAAAHRAGQISDDEYYKRFKALNS